jgi:hypothetical protein
MSLSLCGIKEKQYPFIAWEVWSAPGPVWMSCRRKMPAASGHSARSLVTVLSYAELQFGQNYHFVVGDMSFLHLGLLAMLGPTVQMFPVYITTEVIFAPPLFMTTVHIK